MNLKNQAFARQTESDHRRKLRVVLHKLTGGKLSREQHLAIEQSVQHGCQYRFQVSDSPQLMTKTISNGAVQQIEVVNLFGSAKEPPWAALLQGTIGRKAINTVCIYIPTEKEEDVLDDS